MRPGDIFPYLVTEEYFSLPPGLDPQPRPDQFPPHRPIGHGVSVMLMANDGELRKALHAKDLDEAGFGLDLGEQIAVENLTALVEGGKTFEVQTFETPSGFNFAGWVGNELTASVLLWPSLYQWARDTLKTQRVLVAIPQRRFLFVVAYGNEPFRRSILDYTQVVVKGMDRHIVDQNFELTPDGIVAFSEV